MIAEWFIRHNKLCLSVAYQQQNETSSGTGGCSSNWSADITTIQAAAEKILANVKKTFNWQAVDNLDGWTKLMLPVTYEG